MLTLQIGNPGNMGVMSCLCQGGLCSLECSCLITDRSIMTNYEMNILYMHSVTGISYVIGFNKRILYIYLPRLVCKLENGEVHVYCRRGIDV